MMEFEQVTRNGIDLIEDGIVIGSVCGPNNGEEDVTKNELEIAQRICDGYNLQE